MSVPTRLLAARISQLEVIGMKKFFCLVLAVLCLTGCSLAPESISDTTVPTNAVIPIETETPPLEESIPVESTIPEYFELTEEHLKFTKTNCPSYIGSYVRFPMGYLVDFADPLSPTSYTIVDNIDTETEFKVIGICYLDGIGLPSKTLEDIPPITRATFENIPYYTDSEDTEEGEDPNDVTDFDYFENLGAAIPIDRKASGMLFVQLNENSKIYCVPVGDGLGEFAPRTFYILDDTTGEYISVSEADWLDE